MLFVLNVDYNNATHWPIFFIVFSVAKISNEYSFSCQLQWLKAKKRSDFKLAGSMFKCIHVSVPLYLANGLNPTQPIFKHDVDSTRRLIIKVTHTYNVPYSVFNYVKPVRLNETRRFYSFMYSAIMLLFLIHYIWFTLIYFFTPSSS